MTVSAKEKLRAEQMLTAEKKKALEHPPILQLVLLFLVGFPKACFSKHSIQSGKGRNMQSRTMHKFIVMHTFISKKYSHKVCSSQQRQNPVTMPVRCGFHGSSLFHNLVFNTILKLNLNKN